MYRKRACRLSIKRALFVVLVASALSLAIGGGTWLLSASLAQAPQAPAETWTFQGRVYAGDVGDERYPLQGVTVAVYGANNPYPDLGTFIRSTTTDAEGWYGLDVYDDDGSFEYYHIVETNPANYVSIGAMTVSGTVRTADWIEFVIPLDGQTLTGNKFWDRVPVLSGRVYEGDVGDESQPLEGVVVSLYGANNPHPDSGTFIISTTTNAEGWYGLEATAVYEFYHVRETDPSGYTSVGATTVSGTIRTNNWIEYFIPLDEKTLTGNKFWDQAATTTWTLQGYVYEGDVGNESQPLEGVTVEVYGANNPYPDPGDFIAGATTDASGWYGLEVPDGYEFYHIREFDPEGYTSVGATTVSGTVRTSNWIEYVIPLDGQTLTDNKFWDTTAAATWIFEGRVYEGDVGNESQPLEGVTVAVYGANNPHPDPGELIASTATDAAGWYDLEVTDGYEFYHIRETDPEGYTPVGATTVSGTVRTENWIEYAIPLEGKILTDNKFWDQTATMTYTLEGYVYKGELGDEGHPLEGVLVEVYGANNPYPDPGDFIGDTATDAAGWYGLVVPDGYEFYHIREADPEGYISVGATTVSGTVRTGNWIEYVIPLDGKMLVDNKFWDQPEVTELPDLVVTALWPEESTICYQVMNVGVGTAPAGHVTGLFVDGDLKAGQPVPVDLALDETWSDCFDYLWACTPPEDIVLVEADYEGSLIESNEGNNITEDVWPCDVAPPEIISGPDVLEVTQGSATISWETNEETDSVVRYGREAGAHDFEQADPALVYTHTVVLVDLAPSTTYHFVVQSTDASSNTVESPSHAFETLPAADDTDPSVSLLVEPGTYNGTIPIAAEASDDTGVEMVEFILDAELLFTDYSPPYEFELDTTLFDNGDHTLTARVSDFSGRSATDDRSIDIANLVDATAPSVTITSPSEGATVSGKVNVVATLSDDIGLAYVYFRVDGAFEAFEPLPSHPTSTTVTFEWDTTLVTNTHPRLAVEVYDTDLKYGYATRDVTVSQPTPPAQPKLKVTHHKVTRFQHGFNVELTVQNVGAGAATNVYIQDFLRALQPVSRSTTTPNLADYEAEFMASTKWWDCLITDYVDIPSGQSRTYTFSAIPVLVYPNPPTPSVGETIRLYYEGTDSTAYNEEVKFPVSHTTASVPIATAHANALKEADYLIVTNPQQLFWRYKHDEVDNLLSDMAQLAVYKQGTLGYLYSTDKYALDDLIEPFNIYSYALWGDNWAIRLHPNFSTSLGGYLLIVGETEIVPAWQRGSFSIGVNPVKYSDQPYADTGGSLAPDLIVGRIIGDSASALAKPIQASNGVYGGWPGYDFDRDQALLISGPGYGAFVGDVNTAGNILQSEFSVLKMHWKDYFVVSSFNRDYDAHDGFAVGDVTGTTNAEIVVGDASADQIVVLNSSGSVVSSFSRNFAQGDRLAVGDVTGDARDEIIVGDISADKIAIYNASGTLIYEFNRTFDDGDELALGDVMNAGEDQILHADGSHDYVYITEIQEPTPTTYSDVVTGSFTAAFDPYDDLAVGDLMGDNREEIVIADISQDRIYVRRMDTGLWTNVKRTLEQGDSVAVGYVTGWIKAQILLADVSHRVVTYSWNAGQTKWDEGNIPYSLHKFDGIASGDIGDINGTHKDEVMIADQGNVIRVLDTGNYSSRIHNALPSFTRNSDVVYWSGHGNINVWNGGINSHSSPNPVFPVDFNNHNPFILGTSCLTGNYQDGNYTDASGNFHYVEDKNIAESFLASGAAVYIGATQSSHGYEDREAAKWFFNNWGAYESIGEVFTQLERSYWKGNPNDYWWFWAWEYNLYGDPKFGAVPPSLGAAAAPTLAPTQPPTSTLQVEIPDYVVTTTANGLDWVEIPGGRMWTEGGLPWIPFYSTSIDYPQGYSVQDVALIERTGLITDTGLNVPMVPVTPTVCLCDPGPYSGDLEGWFPEQVYRWETIENPDGSTTLVVVMYPFNYNPLTTDVAFFKNYTFDIHFIASDVALTDLATDRPEYEPGDEVTVNVGLENSGEAQDVIVDAQVKRYGTEEIVDGLPLETLTGLSGAASFSLPWDSSGTEPGYYIVEVTLRNTGGDVLDRQSETFSLGSASGEIAGLSATPGQFSIGDTISISLVFSNTGTVDLSGAAVIEVKDEAGEIVRMFGHDVADLAPGNAVSLIDAWDTSGVESGAYSVVGYVLYDSTATDPVTAVVSTEAYIYLPLVVKSTP